MQDEVKALQDRLNAMTVQTKDACVDTYDEFDDFSKMRERLRDASERNAALVMESTSLRMKAWQDEERVRVARRAVEDAKTDVRMLEAKVTELSNKTSVQEALVLQLQVQVQRKVGRVVLLSSLSDQAIAGVVDVRFLAAVTTVCAKRTGAAATHTLCLCTPATPSR